MNIKGRAGIIDALNRRPTMASEKLEICVLRSGGKECLEFGGEIVAGAWCGVGSTVKTFEVRVPELERIINEHKAREETDRG